MVVSIINRPDKSSRRPNHFRSINDVIVFTTYGFAIKIVGNPLDCQVGRPRKPRICMKIRLAIEVLNARRPRLDHSALSYLLPIKKSFRI